MDRSNPVLSKQQADGLENTYKLLPQRIQEVDVLMARLKQKSSHLAKLNDMYESQIRAYVYQGKKLEKQNIPQMEPLLQPPRNQILPEKAPEYKLKEYMAFRKSLTDLQNEINEAEKAEKIVDVQILVMKESLESIEKNNDLKNLGILIGSQMSTPTRQLSKTEKTGVLAVLKKVLKGADVQQKEKINAYINSLSSS